MVSIFTAQGWRRLVPVLLGAGLLAACQEEAPNPVAQAEEAMRAEPRPAKIFTVSDEVGLLTRRFTGRVEAVQTVDLSFQVPGKLLELPIRESQAVSQGDLIAKIDPTDYARAVREARLRVDQAKRDLDRLETLRDRSVISEKSYDDQKNAYELAVEALRAAEQNLFYTEIRAPFDGIVSLRLVDNFTTIDVGTAVARLQDVSETQIDINVPEALFVKVAENEVQSISAQFLSLPGQEIELEYREHSSQIDPITQTYRVTLAAKSGKDERIIPGMTASVEVKVRPEGLDLSETLLVPSSAVAVNAAGEPYVYVFGPQEGTVTRAPVTVGPIMGPYLPVTDGLSIGDQIVSAGVAYLSDGQSIRPLR
ncbi:hemolysin D [Roseibium aquae]|uniref:Hemolysin D n=1 Tax=Roseibium aquae TaxID=1323746 RepID=A0A916TFX3_9HYPH|nr:efflux RND transporter periplasmic adaptor subunit [Roseibium aquae]GGB43311.1 hemolysin D [Roseibium aquae]